MCIDGTRITVIIIIPDLIKDTFSGQCNAFVFHKVTEELELFETHINDFAVNAYFMGCLASFILHSAHLFFNTTSWQKRPKGPSA